MLIIIIVADFAEMVQIRIKRNPCLWGLILIIFFFIFNVLFQKLLTFNETNSYKSIHRKKSLAINNDRVGLSASGESFLLNGKAITLISGALHYFRLPHQYWEDRLLKMKACGLNTIETYVPWNLHEPLPGQYDFSEDLNIIGFLELAIKLDFLVILRPGPYICSEWEFGGLPSWLLRDPYMKVRTMYPNYIAAVEKYFNKLFSIVKPYQYQHGGPIIAFQLDNEYGAYFKDENYIPYLKKLFEVNGLKELFFVSDSIRNLEKQTIKNVLKTVNFKHASNNLLELKKMQPEAPLMVMEFWTGWFDWWGEKHHVFSLQEFGENLNEILSYGSSVNFYMFFGGTNFGFMNGGLEIDGSYKSDITSYDYDALIAENGDLTPKYYKAKSIISLHFPNNMPARTEFKFLDQVKRISYQDLHPHSFIEMWEVLYLFPSEASKYPKAMEMLQVNNGNGQSYGYTLYSAKCTVGQSFYLNGLQNVKDRGIVFVNKKIELRIDNESKKKTFHISSEMSREIQLDILIENGGRINWLELDNQRKGLIGNISIDNVAIQKWTIYSLEMTSSYIKDLLKHQAQPLELKLFSFCKTELNSPSFFVSRLDISSKPLDTYIDLSEWGKGVVFVNGKNLGRYWSIGPQQTLFLPGPWLVQGENTIVIFEEFRCSSVIKFTTDPVLNQ